MLKSAQPKSPWVVLEEQGFSESDAEEIIKCLYFFPCPKPIREVFYKRSPENKSQWEQKIKEGLGLEWLSKYLYDEEIQRLQKLVVEFSEPEPSPERPFVPGEWQREEPLPNLLLMTGGSKNIRADTVCFAFGKYELAIQWAIGYLQLDLGWFDSVEHMGFTQHQDVEKDVAMYFEFAGDYTSAISWREEHNLGSPRDLARLKFLVGDMVEAERLLRRPPSEFGAYYHGNELRVASKLSEIGKTGEETMCCRSCGAVLKRHWKLCPECQIPVDPRCKCGERIESHWPTCPACGAKQPTPGSTMDLSDASST